MLCCVGSSQKGNELLVYDHNGNYLHGFTFDSNSAVRVGLNGTNVVMYLYRSYIAVTVDSSGTITDVRSILNDNENMRRLDAKLNVKSIPGEGVVYELHKDSGVQLWPGYSYNKLVCTGNDGQQLVLYDATGDAQRRLLFTGIAIPLFIGTVFFILICSIVQNINHQIKASVQASSQKENTEDIP